MENYNLTQTGPEVQEILDNATPQSELTTETQRAQLAEQTLQGNIDAEAQARANAISAETQRAQLAEQTLQTHIDNEALTRENADTLLQTNIGAEETRAKAAERQNADDIDALEVLLPSGVSQSNKLVAQQALEAIIALIPSAASALNKLADKAFVNSSIATNTATFRGTFNLVSDLHLPIDANHETIALNLLTVTPTADNNDYCFVQIPDSAETPAVIASTDRYKFNGTEWEFEYTLNTSGFTSAQWDAINSGITAAILESLTGIPALIPSEATDQNQLADKAYVLTQILLATPAFKGQFTTLTQLQAVTGAKAGDLGIVRTKDTDGHDVFAFYQYKNDQWTYFYSLSYHPQDKPATTGLVGEAPYNGMGRVELPMNWVEGWPNDTWLYYPYNDVVYLMYYWNGLLYAPYNSGTQEGLGLDDNLVVKPLDYNIADIEQFVGQRYLPFTESSGVWTITKPDDSTITSTEMNNTNIYKINDPTHLGINVLTQAMLNRPNTIYVIQHDYNLNGETIEIPEGCVLDFEGGSIYNGILSGELFVEGEYLDLKNISFIYDDPSKATYNGRALNILSGITNRVNLGLSGNVYLAGTVDDFAVKHFILDGNGFTMYLDKFLSFNVKDDIIVNNAKFISTDAHVHSRLFNIPNVNSASNVEIRNCHFEGNLRVLDSWKRDPNNTGKDEILDFIIENNTFENIYCADTAETYNINNIFFLQNTNVLNSKVSNNTVHNFFGCILDYAIANETAEYAISIHEYYKNKGRTIIIENNTVFNDLDYKPWETYDFHSVSTYFSFSVIEEGDVFIRNNVFKNILCDAAGVAVYDNYSGTTTLIYTNNVWQNCVNILNQGQYGAKNTLIKAKGSGKLRSFIGNHYILDDLNVLLNDDSIDMSVLAPLVMTVNYRDSWDTFEFANNRIEADTLRFFLTADTDIKRQIVTGNDIYIKHGVTGAYKAIFDIGVRFNSTHVFSNNTVKIEEDVNDCFFVGVAEHTVMPLTEESVRNVLIENNTFENISIFSGYCDYKEANTVNVIISGNTLYNNSVGKPLVASNSKIVGESNTIHRDRIVLKDNVVYFREAVTFSLFKKWHATSKVISQHNRYCNLSDGNVNIQMFFIDDSLSGLVGYFVRVRNTNKDIKNSYQINYDISEEKAYCIASNGQFSALTSSESFILRDYTDACSVKANNKTATVVLTNKDTYDIDSGFMSISDIYDLKYIPLLSSNSNLSKNSNFGLQRYDFTFKKPAFSNGDRFTDAVGFSLNRRDGSLSDRPVLIAGGDKGYPYFDITVGKLIFWNGTKWIDIDGATAGVLRSGTTSNRPSGDDIYIGFKYFDTSLNKPIYAKRIESSVVTWVESDGAVAGVLRNGSFANKPSASDIYPGFVYMRTDGANNTRYPIVMSSDYKWYNPDGTEATA